MADRDLSNTSPEDAAKTGWVVDAGAPDTWETVAKAHNSNLGLMKSTKRMKVEGGYLYQATTEGPSGYAEALAFVPAADIQLRKQSDRRGTIVSLRQR